MVACTTIEASIVSRQSYISPRLPGNPGKIQVYKATSAAVTAGDQSEGVHN